MKMIQLSKQFDKKDKKIINNFNLEVEEKEFIVFVGPSGCGKSTTLRMIAGLESITDGELWMDGKLVNDVPPKDRDMAMVFQNYALFPHLTVFDNIAFGLKIRKFKKDVINEKVNKAADTLGLTPYLKRKPKELSGGQRQRVALGRAIVRDANVFLMDEPLSNLDAKLRVHMRKEIINLHRELGTTTIYVTHDQTEAMTMATRIVVLNEGYIEQIGTPIEVYNNPKSKFVAGFLGSPSMNFLDGEIKNNQAVLNDGEILNNVSDSLDYEGKVIIGVRPEDMEVTDASSGVEMQVDYVEMMGSDLNVHGKIKGSAVIIRLNPDTKVSEHDRIYLRVAKEKIHVFDSETEQSLLHKEMSK